MTDSSSPLLAESLSLTAFADVLAFVSEYLPPDHRHGGYKIYAIVRSARFAPWSDLQSRDSQVRGYAGTMSSPRR